MAWGHEHIIRLDARPDAMLDGLSQRCPDTSVCPPTARRVFKVEGGAADAATGNLFYAVVINGILYADHKRYTPWISFNAARVSRTMGRAWAKSSGTLWERFFEPYCANVSAWLAVCAPIVTLAPLANASFWYPLVQQQWRWPVRQWYNKQSIEADACASEGWCHVFNETLYRHWRQQGAAIVRSVHRLTPSFRAICAARWRQINPHGRTPVLAMHMRGTDKAGGRPRSSLEHYHDYAFDFLRLYRSGLVVVATDSTFYAAEVTEWVNRSFSTIRCARRRCPFEVVVPPISTRVGGSRGNFQVVRDQLQVAQDALIDIQTLARADYLVHGSSAMAEAAIYTNQSLHCASVDVDYLTLRGPPWRKAPWRQKNGVRAGCVRIVAPPRDAAKGVEPRSVSYQQTASNWVEMPGSRTVHGSISLSALRSEGQG